jgi:succinylglutamate desuccinylase
VKFIIVNERAVVAKEKYIDENLNRIFHKNDLNGSHERDLASRLLEETKGCKVLDLHSTYSTDRPFAVVQNKNRKTMELARASGVEILVEMSEIDELEGSLINHRNSIAIECGFTGSKEAAENCYQIVKNFLSATGVVSGDFRMSDPILYTSFNAVEKRVDNFIGRNFSLVEEGQVYAHNEEQRQKAEYDFYPVLMSDNGYDGILGFQAIRFGPVSSHELFFGRASA